MFEETSNAGLLEALTSPLRDEKLATASYSGLMDIYKDVAVEFYRACRPYLESDFSAGISDDLFAGEFILAIDDLVYELIDDGLVFDKELMSRVLAVFGPEGQRLAQIGYVREDFVENLTSMVDSAK